jgi:hypothetical protein
MKKVFLTLGLLAVLLGFAFPPLWIPAAIFIFIGIGMRSEGRNLDGSKKCGGLLGGFVDDYKDSKFKKKQSTEQ